jgi:type I restriction enzyme R subunit
MDGTNYSEEKTLELIDSELDKWWAADYILREVNTVKSNFKNNDYVLDDGTRSKGDKFIDYLLLAPDRSPLAIIEAKRFSIDPDKGRIQARTYAKDIETQIGRPVSIFLTNGLYWRFIDHDGREREVSGPFSQSDLWRRLRLHLEKRDIINYGVNLKIVDRKRSVDNVSILNKHFSDGYRSALVQMATGTGKTRVSMAVCDSLIQSSYIQNILFIADRSLLVTQANDEGFQDFFKEPVTDLREKFTTSSILYISTVQTLMTFPDGKEKPRMYQKFSPGFFDLVIYDEAHRSYYDKYNVIMEYYDSIKVGLTATPCSSESRNTYQLFGCKDNEPTVKYEYETAVHDGVLVPFTAKIIETDILTNGIDGKGLSEELKDKLRMQGVNPNKLNLKGYEFDSIFMDDETNKLIIETFLDTCYWSDDGLPCKSIFFCASKNHANHIKRMFDIFSPQLSRNVQVITTDIYRYEDEIKRFIHDSEPRIALSVYLFDTGINVPETCNLVFTVPIYSSVRIWQMIGRATRNQGACKHPEWLPGGEKKNFFILDFKIGGHSNIEYHLGKKVKEKDIVRLVPHTVIFMKRLAILNECRDKEQRKIISSHILDTVNDLDAGIHIVRKKLPTLEKIKRAGTFELCEYIKELESEIAPLIKYNRGGNYKVMTFIFEIEDLYRYILDDDKEGINDKRIFFEEYAVNILKKDNLEDVRVYISMIMSMLQDKFWDDLTFSKVDSIVRDFAPLVKYYESDGRKKYQIDAPDKILKITDFEFEVMDNLSIGNLLKHYPAADKIRQGRGITSSELEEMESLLMHYDARLSIGHIQCIHDMDYLQFLRDILKVEFSESPQDRITAQFELKVIGSHNYSDSQTKLLKVALGFFIQNKQLELLDFLCDPLAQYCSDDVFDVLELEEIVDTFSPILMY